MNKNKQLMVFGLVVLFCISIVISKPLFYANHEPSPSPELSESVKYSATVCVSSNSPNGELLTKECSKNLLTTAGRNLIKNYIGSSGSTAVVKYIAMCNATAGCSTPAIGDTTLDNEFVGAGLQRVAGTYISNGNGNWSYWKTFTATSNNVVTNMTGLFNATSGGTLFAENVFTSVTLQINDQLTINWTIAVS